MCGSMVYIQCVTAKIRQGKKKELECGPMPSVMVARRPVEYRWRPVLNAAKFDSRPLLNCRAVTLPIAERKTWRNQREFCTWQNSVTEQQPPKVYTYSLPSQVRGKHCAKFGWLPLSDVAAVTKPRRESR